MAVFLFRQIEGELVIDGEIVVAGPAAGVPVVVIGGVALLAVIPGKAFGAAETLARFAVAVLGLSVAFALLAGSTVHRIAPVAGFALFTVGTHHGVLTRLFASLGIRTSAMAITLATGAVSEVPPSRRTFHFLVGTGIATRKTFSQTGQRAIVTPAAGWIIPTLGTGFVETTLALSGTGGTTFVGTGGPFSTLAVREAGGVGILIDTSLFILTPDALLLGTVSTGGQNGTRRRTWQGFIHDVAGLISDVETLAAFIVPMAECVS